MDTNLKPPAHHGRGRAASLLFPPDEEFLGDTGAHPTLPYSDLADIVGPDAAQPHGPLVVKTEGVAAEHPDIKREPRSAHVRGRARGKRAASLLFSPDEEFLGDFAVPAVKTEDMGGAAVGPGHGQAQGGASTTAAAGAAVAEAAPWWEQGQDQGQSQGQDAHAPSPKYRGPSLLELALSGEAPPPPPATQPRPAPWEEGGGGSAADAAAPAPWTSQVPFATRCLLSLTTELHTFPDLPLATQGRPEPWEVPGGGGAANSSRPGGSLPRPGDTRAPLLHPPLAQPEAHPLPGVLTGNGSVGGESDGGAGTGTGSVPPNPSMKGASEKRVPLRERWAHLMKK